MELKINNWSKELQKEIDDHKPKKDQPVKFRLLIGHPNYDPDPTQKADRPWLYPSIVTIPAKDTIRDPGANDEFIDIGVIDSMGGPDGKTPQFLGYLLTEHDRDGFFYCDVNDQKSMRWFPFLWLSNRRKGNENGQEGIEPMYEFVDVAKEARTRIQNRTVKRTAHQLLSDMDLGEMENIATMYPTVKMPTGYGHLDNKKDVLYDLLYDVVEADPAGFHAKATSPDLDKYVTIDKAIKENIIAYQGATNSYIYVKDETVIVALARSEGKKPIDLFIDWINTNTAGEQALHTIKALLKPGKQKKETAAEKKARLAAGGTDESDSENTE